jgi:transmembrane sensor
MKAPSPDFSADPVSITAANWTVRRDRGLSAAESIEYELWLAADPRHAAAIQRSAAMWSLLDRLPESAAAPVLAATTRRRSFWRRTLISSSLAAAAAVAIGLFVWLRHGPVELPSATEGFIALDAPRTLTLTDGSLVQLNRNSQIVEQFSPTERHVLLAHGEAHFSVVKNPSRPFIVRAGALQVRAVGTAFDIKLQSTAVDVIVTEGRVQLTPASATGTSEAPALNAGERAILHGNISPNSDLNQTLVRSRLDASEMAGALAWREPLLRLGGATLAELAIEFERGTGKHLVFADPSLAELRFGGRFRADDLEGFTQVLATTFDLEVERAADGTIILRKKNSISR